MTLKRTFKLTLGLEPVLDGRGLPVPLPPEHAPSGPNVEPRCPRVTLLHELELLAGEAVLVVERALLGVREDGVGLRDGLDKCGKNKIVGNITAN